MKAQKVDLVLVVDASGSMGPCFGHLRRHLSTLLVPLQQAQFQVRFGVLAYAAGRYHTSVAYDHIFIGGSGPEILQGLYQREVRASDYFTADPARVADLLGTLTPEGDEDTLLALDIAADFPFGPAETTRRVIAGFTDEPLEEGINGAMPVDKIPALIEKLMQRRIQLFLAAPFSPALEQLAAVDRAEIEPVDGHDGLRLVDFKKLLAQMGRSISLATLQAGAEPQWSRALFGQNRWIAQRSATDDTRRVILSVGESARFSNTAHIARVNIKLQWTAPVDLDLHAFYRTRSGAEGHVYFGNKREHNISLDRDAGVGDRGGQNEENITITALKDFATVLFATKIFTKGGSFADYDARVVVETDTGDNVEVPLTSTRRADWVVIAKIGDDGDQRPTVTNVNQVTNDQPAMDAF